MYTIVMDKYKNLNTTVKAVLYQQETQVDTIQFLLPPTYLSYDLTSAIVTLKYTDPNGNFHSEVLVKDEELYKDYVRYTLPVTTKLTAVVGEVKARLTIVKFDDNLSETEVYKLETNSTSIIINKPEGFQDYVNFEDIEAYKAQLSQLNKEVVDLSSITPDDLVIDAEDDKLHLSHEGTSMGEGVAVVTPTVQNDTDNSGSIDNND